MKNYKQICKEVAGDIQAKIENAIIFHEDYILGEYQYGNALIIVETGWKHKDGWLHPYADVVVMHDDCCHTSPRLTQAIEKSLPEWSKIESNIELQMEYLQ